MMTGEKSAGFMSRVRDVAVTLVCACACLLAAAMLAASLAVMRGWFAGMLGFAVAVIGVWLVLDHLSRTGIVRRPVAEMAVLAVLCLAVQLFIDGMMPALGQNGMAAAWDSRAALRAIQSGKICFTHNVRNQYWCNYELLLSAVGAVFRPTLCTGQVLNALCCALVIPPLYMLSLGIGGRGAARLAALVIGMSPAVLLYSTMLTSEFLSASLLFSGFYFACVALRRADLRAAVPPAAISGVFVGLSHLFKSITILYTAALVFVLAAALFDRERRSRRALLLCCVGAAAVLSALAVRTAGQRAFAAFAGEPRLLDASGESSPLLYELALGLNVATDGIYDSDLAVSFVKMDADQRKKFVAGAVRRDWRGYPGLMLRKFVNLHGSHLRPGGAVSSFTLSFRDWPLVRGGRNYTPSWVRPFTDGGTMLFRILFLLGAAGLLASRRRGFEHCLPGVFAATLILGFSAVEQLIEGHGRYKTAIYPFYFMLLPYIRALFGRDCPLYTRLARLAARLRGR